MSDLVRVPARLPRQPVQPVEALGLTPAASELTPEQQAIVADRSRDILVSAGAGSGKTRVLVERYLSLLTECRIPQIAAVTFTDAAATEMRDRVRRAVRERPELAGHRRDLDQAVIGTLHALCRQILREHPVEAGTIAAGRILADDEAEHERVAAALDALEDAAQSRGERARALRELGVYQITEQLPRMVERRDEVRDALDAIPGAAIPGASVDDRERRVRALLDRALADAAAAERPNLERAVAAIREQHTLPLLVTYTSSEAWMSPMKVPATTTLPVLMSVFALPVEPTTTSPSVTMSP